MKRQPSTITRLRTSRISAGASIFAMLLQVLFAAEHLSAMAAASARSGFDGSPLGFLDICTAQGLVRLAPGSQSGDTQRGGSGAGGTCPVCSSACVTGAADTPDAGGVQLPGWTVGFIPTYSPVITPRSQPRYLRAPARGPPFSLSV